MSSILYETLLRNESGQEIYNKEYIMGSRGLVPLRGGLRGNAVDLSINMYAHGRYFKQPLLTFTGSREQVPLWEGLREGKALPFFIFTTLSQQH